jgi:predicted nucleic acid-binding protein
VQAILEDTDSHVLVASVSLPELARRLRELGATFEEARRIVEDYAELVDEVVDVDKRVALSAFDVGLETPQRLPLTDALIAAAARERSACLVHRDRHMVPIPPSVVEQLDLSLVPDS